MKSRKEEEIKKLLKKFCEHYKINCVLADQDLLRRNKVQFNFQSVGEKATLLAIVEFWQQDNLVAIELHEGPIANGYLELAKNIQKLDISVVLYCFNTDRAPVVVFDSRIPPK